MLLYGGGELFMDIHDYPELIDVLKQNQKIVFLGGAGLSMALGEHKQSWPHWISGGRGYLAASEQEELDALLTGTNADDLILAAEYLLEGLQRSGKYHDFMQSSLGNLMPQNAATVQALREIQRTGDFFATTNYDLLLEKTTGIGTITYSNPGEILHTLNESAPRRIIHLHGAYDPAHNINDIVADSGQYEHILADQGAQFIQNLLGTYPIIIVGCGSTISDPNLRGFLTFVRKYLHLSVPYFYLYRAGEETDGLPDNMIPVCYGSEYSELPVFLQKISAFRLRQRINLYGIAIVNPYKESGRVPTAYGRMHFTNCFSRFIGREEEKARLNEFCECPEQLLWWAATGEAGIGKSRLLLDWLQGLPCSWIGFFADTKADPEKFLAFKPFSDTVIVLDYIVGHEKNCGEVMSALLDSFSNTRYKLRIVLLERRYDAEKHDWMDVMVKNLSSAQRLQLQRSAYPDAAGRSDLVPLHLDALKPEEEVQYIQSYLHSYMPVFAPELELDIADTAMRIQRRFREALEAVCYRPLYLSIYIEVWLHSDGAETIKDAYSLLEAYLEKEELRWLAHLDGDNSLLYAYLKLLALACAVEVICINEYNGCFQAHADQLTVFVESKKRAGRKKTSFDGLFIWEQIEKTDSDAGKQIIEAISHSDELPAEEKLGYAYSIAKMLPDGTKDTDRPPKLFYILEPVYPDLIREFIVDYYLDENEWLGFTKTARDISTLEFGFFLAKAIDDFPDKPSFRRMMMIPPEHDTDLFEYYVVLLGHTEEISDWDAVINILCQSSVSEPFGLWELELWKRASIILDRQKDYNHLLSYGLRFADYLSVRMEIPQIAEFAPEVMDAWTVGLHNAEMVDKLTELAERFDKIADQVNENGYLATTCAESRERLLVLHLRAGDRRGARKDYERIAEYDKRFPEDEDIAVCLANATENWVQNLIDQKLLGRVRRAVELLEETHSRVTHEDVAEKLSIVLANEYFLHFRLEDAGSPGTMEHCRSKIDELFAMYPEAKSVVCAYASIQANDYMCLKKACDSQEKCERFRCWKDRWPESIEFAEYYGRTLFARCMFLARTGQMNEMRVTLMELKRLADTTDYGEEENELQNIVEHVELAYEIRELGDAMGAYLD